VQFVVEQLDKSVIAINVPMGDGKMFTPEFERWTTSIMGPREAEWFLDRYSDELVGEAVKLSGRVEGSKMEDLACHTE